MKLDAERQRSLREALEAAGAERREAKGSGEVWRYAIEGATVTLWRTGTVHVQGKGDGLDALRALVAAAGGQSPSKREGQSPSPGAETQARSGDRTAAPGGQSPASRGGQSPASRPDDLPAGVPWAGADESGKGDFFGPLVSAAVVLTPEAALELEAAGVRDSKRLSDGRIDALADAVREAASAHAATVLAPPHYNDRYETVRATGGRLNHLLATLHAESLAAVVEAAEPAYAIVDQFAADRAVVDRAVRRVARDLRVVQYPRAEADVAVAAASILAREAFIAGLAVASARADLELPRGAGPPVLRAARRLVARDGPEALRDVAKLHFATTDKVLAG